MKIRVGITLLALAASPLYAHPGHDHKAVSDPHDVDSKTSTTTSKIDKPATMPSPTPQAASTPAKKKKKGFLDGELSKDRSLGSDEKPYEQDPNAPKKKGLNLGEELGKDRSQK